MKLLERKILLKKIIDYIHYINAFSHRFQPSFTIESNICRGPELMHSPAFSKIIMPQSPFQFGESASNIFINF